MSCRVAIVIFDDVEILDFAGPYEVFGVSATESERSPYDVYAVAQSRNIVRARNGLQIQPQYTFDELPSPNILVIPGGYGTRRERFNESFLAFVRKNAAKVDRVLSVCTGSLILGRAGLLDDLEAVTHHGALDALRTDAPTAIIREDARYIDNGKIVVSAGISAGIDAALHIVAQQYGLEVAENTAKYMEYDWVKQSICLDG